MTKTEKYVAKKLEPLEVNVFCFRLQCPKILLHLNLSKTVQLHRIVLCVSGGWMTVNITALNQNPNAEMLFKILSALLSHTVYACWYFL